MRIKIMTKKIETTIKWIKNLIKLKSSKQKPTDGVLKNESLNNSNFATLQELFAKNEHKSLEKS